MKQQTAQFHREGFLYLPGVLSADEVKALRESVDGIFEDPRAKLTHTLYAPFIAVRLFEWHPIFVDMLAREPIIGLAESILGDDCHLVSNNVVCNGTGVAIDQFTNLAVVVDQANNRVFLLPMPN